jgi:hypothetical protein
MNLMGLVGWILVAGGSAAFTASPSSSTTKFTNPFDAITSGSSVRLAWEGVASQHYPLCITAQLIERSGDEGYGANAYRVNITSMSGILSHNPARVFVSGKCGGYDQTDSRLTDFLFVILRQLALWYATVEAMAKKIMITVSYCQRVVIPLGEHPLSAPVDSRRAVSARAETVVLEWRRLAAAGEITVL